MRRTITSRCVLLITAHRGLVCIADPGVCAQATDKFTDVLTPALMSALQTALNVWRESHSLPPCASFDVDLTEEVGHYSPEDDEDPSPDEAVASTDALLVELDATTKQQLVKLLQELKKEC